MKTLFRIIFLPLKVIGGSTISGFFLTVYKKMPWLNVLVALILSALAIYFVYGV
jgi:hypothetical protein